MPRYTVLIRAIKHCTASLEIEAADERAACDAAEAQASCRPGSILWDESDPEDVQVEQSFPTTTN